MTNEEIQAEGMRRAGCPEDQIQRAIDFARMYHPSESARQPVTLKPGQTEEMVIAELVKLYRKLQVSPQAQAELDAYVKESAAKSARNN